MTSSMGKTLIGGQFDNQHVVDIDSSDCVLARSDDLRMAVLIPATKRGENYHRFDVFLFPSQCDGFGLTLVEAMAVGLPAFSFDIPVVHEIINNGINGLIVRTRDIAKLAEEIKVVIRDQSRLAQMSKQLGKKLLLAFHCGCLCRKLNPFM